MNVWPLCAEQKRVPNTDDSRLAKSTKTLPNLWLLPTRRCEWGYSVTVLLVHSQHWFWLHKELQPDLRTCVDVFGEDWLVKGMNAWVVSGLSCGSDLWRSFPWFWFRWKAMFCLVAFVACPVQMTFLSRYHCLHKWRIVCLSEVILAPQGNAQSSEGSECGRLWSMFCQFLWGRLALLLMLGPRNSPAQPMSLTLQIFYDVIKNEIIQGWHGLLSQVTYKTCWWYVHKTFLTGLPFTQEKVLCIFTLAGWHNGEVLKRKNVNSEEG